MSLAALIRKGGLRELATATLATPATVTAETGSVATVAGVAVAKLETIEPSNDEVPARIRELMQRCCVWHVPTYGGQDRYVVGGPDHNICDRFPHATPMFSESHRNYVRSLLNTDEGKPNG